ncbi:MAG TPA: TadE/TadG family type IV pilus assembly protein [Caulobacteraceae bacterium]|nr:TadE/TadG family type IV pilus assembly protein [Caulobacteraceae bacterium]
MLLKRFRRDISAVAAVEFAIIAPLMILSYFGLADVTQGLIAQRRISHAAATIGDLVSQESGLHKADINDIFTVGNTIVSPYPTAPLEERVTSITANASGATTVAWSEASNMAPLSGAVTVPAHVVSANQSVIRSDVVYVYSSPINYIITTPITFSYTYYLKPRISQTVTCYDC